MILVILIITKAKKISQWNYIKNISNVPIYLLHVNFSFQLILGRFKLQAFSIFLLKYIFFYVKLMKRIQLFCCSGINDVFWLPQQEAAKQLSISIEIHYVACVGFLRICYSFINGFVYWYHCGSKRWRWGKSNINNGSSSPNKLLQTD